MMNYTPLFRWNKDVCIHTPAVGGTTLVEITGGRKEHPLCCFIEGLK